MRKALFHPATSALRAWRLPVFGKKTKSLDRICRCAQCAVGYPARLHAYSTGRRHGQHDRRRIAGTGHRSIVWRSVASKPVGAAITRRRRVATAPCLAHGRLPAILTPASSTRATTRRRLSTRRKPTRRMQLRSRRNKRTGGNDGCRIAELAPSRTRIILDRAKRRFEEGLKIVEEAHETSLTFSRRCLARPAA